MCKFIEAKSTDEYRLINLSLITDIKRLGNGSALVTFVNNETCWIDDYSALVNAIQEMEYK